MCSGFFVSSGFPLVYMLHPFFSEVYIFSMLNNLVTIWWSLNVTLTTKNAQFAKLFLWFWKVILSNYCHSSARSFFPWCIAVNMVLLINNVHIIYHHTDVTHLTLLKKSSFSNNDYSFVKVWISNTTEHTYFHQLTAPSIIIFTKKTFLGCWVSSRCHKLLLYCCHWCQSPWVCDNILL